VTTLTKRCTKRRATALLNAVSFHVTENQPGGVMASKARKSKSTGELGSIYVEERIASLFEPDTLLSAQYMETLRRNTLLEPEKRLMLAMLEDAINCFQAYVTMQGGRQRKMFNDAEKWIMMMDDDWIFSFVSVCETLGFNPEYVRQGLWRWKQKRLGKPDGCRGLETEKDDRLEPGQTVLVPIAI
jgi:hypothetical protein